MTLACARVKCYVAKAARVEHCLARDDRSASKSQGRRDSRFFISSTRPIVTRGSADNQRDDEKRASHLGGVFVPPTERKKEHPDNGAIAIAKCSTDIIARSLFSISPSPFVLSCHALELCKLFHDYRLYYQLIYIRFKVYLQSWRHFNLTMLLRFVPFCHLCCLFGHVILCTTVHSTDTLLFTPRYAIKRPVVSKPAGNNFLLSYCTRAGVTLFENSFLSRG